MAAHVEIRASTPDSDPLGDADGLKVKGANSVSETATIANGASLSGAVDCGSARLALIVMPAAWTTADLTFQESADGVTYVDKYDAFGAEYTVVCGGTSRSLTINLVDFIGTRYLKVRSGTTGTPVVQGGARDLTLVLQP